MLAAGNRLNVLARHHPGVLGANEEAISWPPVRLSLKQHDSLLDLAREQAGRRP